MLSNKITKKKMFPLSFVCSGLVCTHCWEKPDLKYCFFICSRRDTPGLRCTCNGNGKSNLKAYVKKRYCSTYLTVCKGVFPTKQSSFPRHDHVLCKPQPDRRCRKLPDRMPSGLTFPICQTLPCQYETIMGCRLQREKVSGRLEGLSCNMKQKCHKWVPFSCCA